MLEMSGRDLVWIMNEEFDRFKVTFHGLPNGDGENALDYIEDDGRQYRIVDFTDSETGDEYYFQYTYHPDWETIFPDELLVHPDGITFVKDDRFIPKPVPKPKPVVVKTKEQLNDEELMAQYAEGLATYSEYKKGSIPAKVTKEIKDWMKTAKFSIYDLRAKIIPVCIEYKITHESYWAHIQGWKKSK